jgi:hypothetical protein
MSFLIASGCVHKTFPPSEWAASAGICEALSRYFRPWLSRHT